MKPKRIQRKRTKGWRMPPNTVYVGRPTKWGNPFPKSEPDCLAHYRQFICAWAASFKVADVDVLGELRGRDLACWCPENAACHADILLELANA